jgi:hypothetical protein
MEPQTPAGFTAGVQLVDDPKYESLAVSQLLNLAPADAAFLAFLVHRQALTHPDGRSSPSMSGGGTAGHSGSSRPR